MAEKELLHRMGERLTILRPGNVMGPPVYTGQNSTFIAWVSKSMENAGRVHLNVDRGTVKDFITRDYFQQVLAAFARKPEPGVWNVGAGFGVSLAHLLDCMVGEERYDDTPSVAPSDQFILDVSKLRIAMGLSITPAQLDAQCERNRIAFDAAQVAPLSVAKSEAVA
jgi:nucleoside-diphosphate-sugar epimerase